MAIVSRWLAVMHARLTGGTRRLAGAASLLRYDADFYGLWIQRARTARGWSASSQPGAVRSGMERLARRYDRASSAWRRFGQPSGTGSSTFPTCSYMKQKDQGVNDGHVRGGDARSLSRC